MATGVTARRHRSSAPPAPHPVTSPSPRARDRPKESAERFRDVVDHRLQQHDEAVQVTSNATQAPAPAHTVRARRGSMCAEAWTSTSDVILSSEYPCHLRIYFGRSAPRRSYGLAARRRPPDCSLARPPARSRAACRLSPVVRRPHADVRRPPPPAGKQRTKPMRSSQAFQVTSRHVTPGQIVRSSQARSWQGRSRQVRSGQGTSG